MDISFPGKRVLVTGAVRGIGRKIAHCFAAEGAEVHAADIEAALLDEVAAEAAAPISVHGLDVTDSAAVNALIAKIGPVDIVVHAAGGVRGQRARPIEEVTDADWRQIQDVNLTGAFYVARAAATGMKAKGWGRIVIISSGAGLRVSRTGIHSYGVAKTAEIGFARQLSAELGPHGITVNSVAPGFMPTSPDYIRQWESYGEEGQQALIEGTAMRRLGKPEDIAHAVMFLASDYASWITGQTLPVMGGP